MLGGSGGFRAGRMFAVSLHELQKAAGEVLAARGTQKAKGAAVGRPVGGRAGVARHSHLQPSPSRGAGASPSLVRTACWKHPSYQWWLGGGEWSSLAALSAQVGPPLCSGPTREALSPSPPPAPPRHLPSAQLPRLRSCGQHL